MAQAQFAPPKKRSRRALRDREQPGRGRPIPLAPLAVASARPFGPHLSARLRVLKRGIDVAGAVVGLILLAPVFAVLSVLVLVASGRPVFFFQERVGQGGRIFRMCKFRSMRGDAERDTGPIWASSGDARCTRIGAWLRRTNLDELPQLFNVLAGQMSLVGPRPERPFFVQQFVRTYPDYEQRHALPVGMTGWAQVHGWRGRTSLRRRLDCDLEYVRRWSLGLDLLILARTVEHVLWGRTSWDS